MLVLPILHSDREVVFPVCFAGLLHHLSQGHVLGKTPAVIVVGLVCAQDIDSVCDFGVLGSDFVAGHRRQGVVLVLMKRYSLEGGVQDLVSWEQVRLLFSLLFVGFVLIVGDWLSDVVEFPLLVVLVVEIDWAGEHLLFDQGQLSVHCVLVLSVHDYCSLERSLLLL